jgi:hypothetical protein
LGDWHLTVSLLQSWLDQWAALLSKVPEGMALAAILLPVVVAIFSKRLIVVLGCMLLAVIAFCAIVVPSDMVVTLASGVYLGSLIIALSGVVARRNARVLQAEFASLREEMKRLREDLKVVSDAGQRRFLMELRSSKKESPGAKSTIPASGNPSASTGAPPVTIEATDPGPLTKKEPTR